MALLVACEGLVSTAVVTRRSPCLCLSFCSGESPPLTLPLNVAFAGVLGVLFPLDVRLREDWSWSALSLLRGWSCARRDFTPEVRNWANTMSAEKCTKQL